LKKHNLSITPEKKQVEGRRLGSASITIDTIQLSPISPPPQDNIQTATPSTLTVDIDSPTTTLKIRLIDGTTKELTVNHSHTLSQIVEHLRRISGVSDFKLVNTSAYPRKTLTDLNQTVKEANLFNTNLTQTR